MCRIIAVMLAILTYAGLTGTAGASQEHVESLSQLFSSSSVVFAGEVRSVERTGQHDGIWYGESVSLETFIAHVSVDREYKGPTDVGSLTINFVRPPDTVCSVSRCETLRVGDDGLFFLKQEDDGYHLLDPKLGRLSISRLKSPEATSGVAGLQADLSAGFHDNDEKHLLTNIELYGASQHAPSSPLLELLRSNTREAVRAAANEALLRLGDHSRLKEAARIAELRTSEPRELFLQQEICSQIREIRDRTTVQVLLAFANSPSDQLREAVIHALREMGSVDAVPVFVQALDDHIELIRYDAVLGLATVEKNWELAPSIDSFREDQSKYISSWKSWWLTTGKSLYR